MFNIFGTTICVVLAGTITLSTVIILDATVGLHSLFGYMGDVDFIVSGAFVTIPLVYAFTLWQLRREHSDKYSSFLLVHLQQSGLVYMLLILLLVSLNVNPESLKFAYVTVVTYVGVVAVVTNFIGLYLLHAENVESV